MRTKGLLIFAAGIIVVFCWSVVLLKLGRSVKNDLPQAAIEISGAQELIRGHSISETWREYEKEVRWHKRPPGLSRSKEVAFTRQLPRRDNDTYANDDIQAPDWQSRGPYHVGGRTRALALDVANPNIILAGGVSGGLWRSTDGGDSWTKVTGLEQNQNVTCIAQDTRPGKTQTWYYGTGERWGTRFPGDGVFKSTDNGVSWTQLPATASNEPQDEGVSFNWCYNIAVDPSNDDQDEVYVAAEGAIFRSIDGGDSWETYFESVIFIEEFSQYDEVPTDVAVSSDGVVYTTVAKPLFSDATEVQGIWRSADGVNWTEITPQALPEVFSRTVMDIAPSDENLVYFLAYTPGHSFNYTFLKYTYLSGDGAGEGGHWQDLSANLTDPSSASNFIGQYQYDMVVSVKPDDPDVVYVGGVYLFRSTDGFATADNTKNVTEGADIDTWLHVDQHAVTFSPSDANVVFVGNDGGVYRSTHDHAGQGEWTSLNRGYTTTQFYCVALDPATPESNILIGGTQDNGGLYTNSTNEAAGWTTIAGGDGLDCDISAGAEFYYMAGFAGVRYLGQITVDEAGEQSSFQSIKPEDTFTLRSAFLLDPSDNHTIYYPAGKTQDGFEFMNIWRYNTLDQPYVDENWDELENSRVEGAISALGISTSSPAHRLYYGVAAPGSFETGIFPKKLYRLDEAHAGDPAPTDISSPEFPDANFSSIAGIAVDPLNGDHALVAFSGYNIKSLFFTEDGGASWSDVSGNLEQFPDGSGNGPSLFTAAILPLDNGQNFYLVGGTTGLYSTVTLNGAETEWLREGGDDVGFTPVYDIAIRTIDNIVAVATYGNGIFNAFIESAVVSVSEPRVAPERFLLHQSYPNPFNPETVIRYELAHRTDVKLEIFDTLGRTVRTLVNSEEGPGVQQVQWDGTDAAGRRVASGLYLYRLRAGEFVTTRRMLLLR